MDIDQIKNLDFSQFSDAEIMEHFNSRCQIDGLTYQVACHHIVFQSQGGTANPRIPLCSDCHNKMHSNAEFRKKYEPKLFKIAWVFYQLQTQKVLF